MKKIEMNKEINVNVRFAESRDIPKILDLLSQVLQIHANGRPDIFKYNIRQPQRNANPASPSAPDPAVPNRAHTEM